MKSNGGPSLYADDLRTEIHRLEAKARERARVDVTRLIASRFGDISVSTRFAPSRLRKCPRDASLVAEFEAASLMFEAERVLPQINWLKRKIARIEGNT